MKELYNKYLNNELKLEKWQIIGVICLIIVISGLFGWVYEYIFYYFNGGMKKFYWRGGNFLPWINIYATGALIIIFFTRKLKKHPLRIFLVAVLATGILEYFSGLVIYEVFHQRFWDYNTEILNFGNLNGYICLRSVGFFGLSALLLMYVIVPICICISQKMNKKAFLILSITLCTLVLFDESYNLIFARILKTPRACDVYKKIGFNFMNYK